ncbi:unnamed protein product [Closterium sp. Naga37s-1]|nr:unnamed protein product [Closterium sp. Naga37s-1]
MASESAAAAAEAVKSMEISGGEKPECNRPSPLPPLPSPSPSFPRPFPHTFPPTFFKLSSLLPFPSRSPSPLLFSSPRQGQEGSVRDLVAQLVAESLAKTFPDLSDLEPLVTTCNNPKFGDYQCNNAMGIWSRIKGSTTEFKNPNAIGQAIAKNLPPSPMVEKTSIAGPGFVNIVLTQAWLEDHVSGVLKGAGIAAWAPKLPVARALVDFSSLSLPNNHTLSVPISLPSLLPSQAIAKNLPPSPMVEKTSIAGPGFVNIVLTQAWLEDHVSGVLKGAGIAAWAPKLPVARALVDFSSLSLPNNHTLSVPISLPSLLPSQAIAKNLPPSPMVEKTSIAGPGFVNIVLTQAWLEDHVSGVLKGAGIAAWAPKLPVAQAVVDFSSPNIAKEMHVGHLRSTIIGDTLARMLEYCHVEVLRRNHVGDWGTQFGMLIEYLFDKFPDWETVGEQAIGDLQFGMLIEYLFDKFPDWETIGDQAIGDLQVFYKAAKKRFDEDAEFKERAQRAVVKLQGGRGGVPASRSTTRASLQHWKRSRQLGWWWRGESFYNSHIPAALEKLKAAGLVVESEGGGKEFGTFFSSSSHFSPTRPFSPHQGDFRGASKLGESFYNSRIPAALEKLKAAGLVVESEGAQCIFVEGHKVPLIVVKSDGGFNYATTDLTCLLYCIEEEKAEWVVNVIRLSHIGGEGGVGRPNQGRYLSLPFPGPFPPSPSPTLPSTSHQPPSQPPHRGGDMADYRIEEEKAEWVVYVTDVGQSQHFDMFFKFLKVSSGLEQVSQGFYAGIAKKGKAVKAEEGEEAEKAAPSIRVDRVGFNKAGAGRG